MVSNEFNIFGAAPDKGSLNVFLTISRCNILTKLVGTQDGPDWGKYGGLQGYLKSLSTNFSKVVFDNGNITIEKRQRDSWWLTQLGPLGKAC
jgi:hypothetical protein